jgi:hypothetical protein
MTTPSASGFLGVILRNLKRNQACSVDSSLLCSQHDDVFARMLGWFSEVHRYILNDVSCESIEYSDFVVFLYPWRRFNIRVFLQHIIHMHSCIRSKCDRT